MIPQYYLYIIHWELWRGQCTDYINNFIASSLATDLTPFLQRYSAGECGGDWRQWTTFLAINSHAVTYVLGSCNQCNHCNYAVQPPQPVKPLAADTTTSTTTATTINSTTTATMQKSLFSLLYLLCINFYELWCSVPLYSVFVLDFFTLKKTTKYRDSSADPLRKDCGSIMDAMREDCGSTADAMRKNCGPAADETSEYTPGSPYLHVVPACPTFISVLPSGWGSLVPKPYQPQRGSLSV